MKIIFRYDDYSAAPRQSWEIDKGIFDLFLSQGFPLVVGVTPRMSRAIRDAGNQVFYRFEEDRQRLGLLAEGLSQGWQLALHGLTHQRTARADGTEFAGELYEVQYARIREGRAVLESCFPGVPLTIFIPPWNTFDQTTVRCAPGLGFEILCSGQLRRYDSRPDLAVLPSWLEVAQLHAYTSCYSTDDLVRVVGSAYLVVTMHEYEFRPGKVAEYVSLARLAELLREFRARGIAISTLPPKPDAAEFMPRRARALEARLYFLGHHLVSQPGGLAHSARRAALRLGRAQPAWASDPAVIALKLADRALSRARSRLH